MQKATRDGKPIHGFESVDEQLAFLDGLSLDAQRETCEAYVASQKHEGWVVLPAMYDDGGVSGGYFAYDRSVTDSYLRRTTDVVCGRTFWN